MLEKIAIMARLGKFIELPGSGADTLRRGFTEFT